MSSTKTRRRRQETEARLQRSLLGALSDSSFQELTIEEIADAAGLSRSAFYFYYPDKRSLLMDATTGVADTLFEQADRWWHGEGEPDELVRLALHGVAAGWVANDKIFRTAVEVSTYDERMHDFWRGTLDRFVEGTVEHIEREKELGRVLPSLDARGTAEVLVWSVERTLYIYALPDERSVGELVSSMSAVWLRAIYGISPGA